MKTLMSLILLAAAVPAAAETVTVRYSDLNLTRAEGMATLDSRLADAARRVCSTGSRDLSVQRQEAACRAETLAAAQGTARQLAATQAAATQLAAGR